MNRYKKSRISYAPRCHGTCGKAPGHSIRWTGAETIASKMSHSRLPKQRHVILLYIHNNEKRTGRHETFDWSYAARGPLVGHSWNRLCRYWSTAFRNACCNQTTFHSNWLFVEMIPMCLPIRGEEDVFTENKNRSAIISTQYKRMQFTTHFLLF